MKKTFIAALSAAVMLSLTACGRKEEKPVQTEEAAAAEKTETEVPETPSPVPTPETTEEPEDHNYTDSKAFEGFASAVTGWQKTVTLGKSAFKETGYPTASVSQYKDSTHDHADDIQSLEPGAAGIVRTGSWAKTGGEICVQIYNPSDAPVPAEDCVIIGISDDEGLQFTGNGLGYYSRPEEFIAVLGEPYDIKGTQREDYFSGTYIWRDESGQHQVTMSFYQDGDIFESDGISYSDFSLTDN